MIDQIFTEEMPWAIRFSFLKDMAVRSAVIGSEEMERYAAALKDFSEEAPSKTGSSANVAVIPIVGPIMKRASFWSMVFGGASQDVIAARFEEAVNDPEIDAVLLDIDSPGGVASGVDALSQMIFDARGIKPIVAFTNGMMASAAYYIGSAADVVVADKTAFVGSIGVITTHYDWSKFDERMGLKVTVLHSGKYKALGNDAEPLSKLAKDTIQAELDYLYTLFVDAVARNRGVSSKIANDRMSEGRIFIGRQAVDAGLVDYIGAYEGAVAAAKTLAEGGDAASVLAGTHSRNFFQSQTVQHVEGGENPMTLDELKAKYPDLFKQIQAETTRQVTADLQTTFDQEKKRMKDEFEQTEAALKKENEKLTQENAATMERVLKLEKKDAIRTETELRDKADRIWNTKLSASEVADYLHDKVKQMVTHQKFVKDGALDQQAFEAAVDEEIEDWESRGAVSTVKGTGYTRKEPEGSEAKNARAVAEQNEKAVDQLAGLAGISRKSE